MFTEVILTYVHQKLQRDSHHIKRLGPRFVCLMFRFATCCTLYLNPNRKRLLMLQTRLLMMPCHIQENAD
jgi:hypothetical protein